MLKFRFMIPTFIALGTTLFAADYWPDEVTYPSSFPLLERKGYSLVYDGRFKIPFWTLEHLTKENVSGKIDRRLSFREDEDIYEHHQSTNDDYTHSGFQRGHMVPDADRDNTLDILKETYVYSNACPQPGHFNNGIWKRLEQFARDLVTKAGYDSVDVISGPLFLPTIEENGNRFVKYQVIGENNVAVPTHFFKVFYAHYKDTVDTSAYIIPVEGYESNDLDDYLETIEKVEKVSGLVLNP